MAIQDTLASLRRAGEIARWKVETLGRVGKKLGVHRSVRWPGVKMVLRDLSRGKTNPSMLFRFYTANDPERTALVQAGAPGRKDGAQEIRRLSYRATNELIDRVGLALARRGIGKGSAVLVLLKNRIEFFLIGPAANRIGASSVTVSWRSTVPEIEYLARHSGASAMFFDVDLADTVREVRGKLEGIPRRNYFSVGGEVAGFESLEGLVEHVRGEPEDMSKEAALVLYTSGTTGKPKGAVRKFQPGALATALAFIEQTPLQIGEVHLSVCPLYHATAQGFSTLTFLLGGTVVVLADFRPEHFLDAVERYRITSTAMVPTMIHRVVELGPEAIRARDTGSLRAMFSGGAPLGGALAVEAMDALGDKIYNFYGSTETGLVTLASPADLRAAPGTIGPAVPGNEIRLVDEKGRDVRAGEVGELFARSLNMIEGYHADADATKRSMMEGYFSVGDLARRDRDGRYHIEGRKRDMIISGGVNVYPAEVEAALEGHPAVGEVAVVGVPDKEWGERVRAFVVKRPGREATEDELKAFCRERLAGPKVPRDFVFMDALPRNPTGKILKRELRAVGGG
jgi:fatty-acyl-CoA synthase